MQWRPLMRRALWGVLTAVVVFATALWVTLRLSLPDLTGEQELRGLEQPVAVTYDEHGISTIKATSRRDAYRALGYVTARDRLFQMDLFRRSASGRLAEIFGQDAVELDTEQRIFGFQQVAAAVSARLSEHERQTLQAYADGVNAFLIQAQVLPFEFIVLQYRPDPWTIEDSCLVMLYLYQKLSWSDLAERTMTVMEQTLPADVVAFLTPDSDPYTVALFGGTASHRPMQQLPRAGLASLLQSSPRESPPRRRYCKLPHAQPDLMPGRWTEPRRPMDEPFSPMICTTHCRFRASGIGPPSSTGQRPCPALSRPECRS